MKLLIKILVFIFRIKPLKLDDSTKKVLNEEVFVPDLKKNYNNKNVYKHEAKNVYKHESKHESKNVLNRPVLWLNKPSSPVDGSINFDINSKHYYIYDGIKWEKINE